MSQTYLNLDFGTKPSTSKLEEVAITIDDTMIPDYAAAYLREAYRLNPVRARELNLTQEELVDYFSGILAIRIESTQPGGCKQWREAKQLVIPSFLQFVISQVGIVIDHQYGFKFVPHYHYDYDVSEMLDTSVKLEILIKDGLAAEKDAFPRSPEGDKDTMGFIIVNQMVNGRFDNVHPIHAYVAAFLGLKLQEEIAYKVLYHIPYEDVNFIRDSLIHERSILTNA